jgi:hypothetical protein
MRKESVHLYVAKYYKFRDNSQLVTDLYVPVRNPVTIRSPVFSDEELDPRFGTSTSICRDFDLGWQGQVYKLRNKIPDQ